MDDAFPGFSSQLYFFFEGIFCSSTFFVPIPLFTGLTFCDLLPSFSRVVSVFGSCAASFFLFHGMALFFHPTFLGGHDLYFLLAP